ncbi:PKD domain-containing protein [Massilia arenae]|uniref:PKD domain-containing protein n=1 Tax=Massilia arenae TaxID=2603288 RepID=A0A5C7G2Y3_9BURK|nr:PKD domain-containing protein [Massilia arenae]TXF98930.1 PKD domain-containing protein [Massilia arenae]
MQANTNAAQSSRHHCRSRMRRLRYPVAILCLSMSTALSAGPLPPPPNVLYRIVPLAPDASPNVDINAKGQVAFSEYVALFVHNARMYDGVQVRKLGSLVGDSNTIYTTAVALNDLGQVTGLSFLAPMGNGYHAYRWSAWSGMVNLSPPGLLASEGIAINNLGMVAGNARHSLDTEERAFRWIPGLGMRDLGSLNAYSNVTAMNDAGVVVGLSDAAPTMGWSYTVPTRWTLAPVPQPLLSNQFPWSSAMDINAAGHIVGHGLFAPNPSNSRSSFFWMPRKGAIDLRVPGDSWAVKMNDKDMVVGETATGPGNVVGFVWTPKNGPLLLGNPGTDQSTGRDVNKHGQVVGRFNSRAFVWTRAAGLVDLNTRLRDAPDGFELDEAHAISDNGSIVASTTTGALVLLVPGACAKAAPVIGTIKSLGAARPGALLTFAAAFRDSDLRDAHTASWSWGDGNTSAGSVAAARGSGGVSGQHTYRTPGVYQVRLTVSDSGGERSVAQSTVVVGQSGIVLAGDGRFWSPRGASRLASHDPGIARFSFRSAGDASDGGGKAAIRFSAPGIEFDSGGYDALAHDPAGVRYEGSGVLNGRHGHRFVLSVVRDAATADAGRIHVRITHRDAVTGADVLDYDNAVVDASAAAGSPGAPLIAGSKVSLGAD